MRTSLILFISFAFICTPKASEIADLTANGLPVKVLSSSKSYKEFEQYPWEGHSSNYGPKGNRLIADYGVGLGKKHFPLFTIATWRLDSHAGYRLAAN